MLLFLITLFVPSNLLYPKLPIRLWNLTALRSRLRRFAPQRILSSFVSFDRMAALGFEKTAEEGRFRNNLYEVWDLVPRNVLVDDEGDVYVVDAEIKRI